MLAGPHPRSLALRRSKTRCPRAGRRRLASARRGRRRSHPVSPCLEFDLRVDSEQASAERLVRHQPLRPVSRVLRQDATGIEQVRDIEAPSHAEPPDLESPAEAKVHLLKTILKGRG